MALDMGKLKKVQTDLDEGNDDILYQNKFGAETDFRILPPTEEMDGVYFVEYVQHWIGGKPYLSNATFGDSDVVKDEIDRAKKLEDKDVAALLADDKKLKLGRKQYLVPGLQLDVTYHNDNTVKSIAVKGDKAKFLSCSSQLLSAINKEVTSRFTQPDITDRVKGFNILLTKTGANLDTEYSARAWRDQYEMPEPFYVTVPNPYEYLRSIRKTDAYLISVIRNYLYGEPLLKDEKPETAPERKTQPAAANTAPSRQREEPVAEPKAARKVEKEAPAEAPARSKAGSSLLADLDED